MPVKLIVRVSPDDRVFVTVEGLTERDRGLPSETKLCKKITSQLEEDLGSVARREFADDPNASDLLVSKRDHLKLGD